MKILVVGVGSIGRRHAQNAKQFAETAICECNAELGQEVATELCLPLFMDLNHALDWKPDHVIVATPTHIHLAVADRAIESGAHVLIEKPISHSLDNVKEFLDKAELLGKKVFVVCNMRFHPAVQTLARNINGVGKPLFVRAQYGNWLPDMRPGADYRTLYCSRQMTGGGVILDAIHEIDYISWLLGSVQTVICNAGRLSNLDIDVEDYAELLSSHSTGVMSEIHMDYLQRFKRRGCDIIGTDGTLVWLSEGKTPENCEVRLYRSSSRSWKTLYKEPNLNPYGIYQTLFENYLRAANGEQTDMLTGRAALEVLSIVFAAKDSAATGRRISLNPTGVRI